MGYLEWVVNVLIEGRLRHDGADSVRPINVSADVIRPSVYRNANLNAMRSIKLI